MRPGKSTDITTVEQTRAVTNPKLVMVQPSLFPRRAPFNHTNGYFNRGAEKRSKF
jgi:hypothetical protein